MCGITGVLAFEADSPLVTGALIEHMRDTMPHRGPDAAGVYRGPHIALGQRRLSIIDLAGGAQPMYGDDEQIVVLNNGEIYNYHDLMARYGQAGYTFRTQSDTEAILGGYCVAGTDVIPALRGMFALAIWDAREQALYLARDRAGQKPLYYAQLPAGFFFASEIKALLAYPDMPREIDPHALHDYFTYQSIPEPLTIFRHIRKLPPGHWLRCDLSGRVTIQRYWRWAAHDAPTTTLSYPEAVEALREQLAEAVRLRLISDVPLGALLSGGVDSAGVVAMMARAASGPVRTFTIGFAGTDDERAAARESAAMHGAEHTELVVQPDHIRDILPQLAWQYDEPFADTSALPTYYVCKLARQHVTVALGGDGGDEAFAGYARYAKLLRFDGDYASVRPFARAVVNRAGMGVQGIRTLRLLAVSPAERYQQMHTLWDAAGRARLLPGQPRGGRGRIAEIMAGVAGDSHLRRAQVADFEVYLPATVLAKVDRASMLNSLEVRAPFLDHELLDFAATLPPEWLLGKRVLKDALRGSVPPGVLTRPKSGFGAPLHHWFAGDFGTFARDILLDDATRRRGWFDVSYLEKLLQRQARPWGELTQALWAALMFELWCRAYDIQG
ncbi:MAG: asparagine synthase (glutamine-hydrolyzing) [Anaerolineales bacterium]